VSPDGEGDDWEVAQRLSDTLTQPPHARLENTVSVLVESRSPLLVPAIAGGVIILAAILSVVIAVSGGDGDGSGPVPVAKPVVVPMPMPVATTAADGGAATARNAARPAQPAASPSSDLEPGADDTIVKVPGAEPISSDSVTGLEQELNDDDRPRKRRRVTAVKAAPKPVVKKDGEIEILVRPWGQVYVDGADRGSTPLRPVTVAPGRHEIVVHHPSFGKRRRVITVKAGETTRLSVDMRTE
jgi:non-specific serine/threonine protein kinase